MSLSNNYNITNLIILNQILNIKYVHTCYLNIKLYKQAHVMSK